MTDVDNHQRYAPPQALIDEPQDDGGLTPGGRGQRLGAALLDGVVMMVITLGMLYALYGTGFTTLAERGPLALIGPYLAIFAIYLALQSWFLYRSGQTLGKMALGLRIVRTDGSRAALPRLLFLRQGLSMALGLVPFLGRLYGLVDSLFIFGAPRRCLHDYIADTMVVTAASAPHAVLAR
jgi:uncharacterized RDD family membrane protein YckC